MRRIDRYFTMNMFMQVGLVGFTAGGYLLTSLKLPQYGVIAGAISQIFWVYASWRAWKEAKQYGVMITTAMIACIMFFGILNYWVL